MKKIISWILTVCLWLWTLVMFSLYHPIQVILHRLSYRTCEKMAPFVLFTVIFGARVIGVRIRTQGLRQAIPVGRPLIIVSNHQSVFDIPLIYWFLRHQNVKFIAKKELAKGIPSVSFCLRNVGHSLIDRADGEKSLANIRKTAQDVNRNQNAICIFPEGTRARKGQMKSFKLAGLSEIIRNMPDALILPVVLNKTYLLQEMPIPFRSAIHFEVLEPFEMEENTEKTIRKVEQILRQKVASLNNE
jgi:1-acyl-sn-glycerol-3-phosphate acyltransferase